MKVKGVFLFTGSYETIAVLMKPTAIWKRSKLMAVGFKHMGMATGSTDAEVIADAEDQLSMYHPQWMSYDEIINMK